MTRPPRGARGPRSISAQRVPDYSASRAENTRYFQTLAAVISVAPARAFCDDERENWFSNFARAIDDFSAGARRGKSTSRRGARSPRRGSPRKIFLGFV